MRDPAELGPDRLQQDSAVAGGGGSGEAAREGLDVGFRASIEGRSHLG